METEKKSSHGALIGSIIIVLVLVIGGIYVWQQKDKSDSVIKQMQEEQATADSTNEVNNLEQEVNSVDTNIDINTDAIE